MWRLVPPRSSESRRATTSFTHWDHIDYDIEDDDPPRTWVFGFARDLTLLELLILHDTPGGRVIHCMKARPKELEKALRARGR
jgi:hypothetical protein